MRAVAIPCTVKGGRLKISNPSLYDKVIRGLPTDKRLRMWIEPAEKITESDPMRRYYFSVVAEMIAEETGHGKDTIHDWLKRKILGVTVDKWGIETVPSVFGRGSKLDLSQKWAFIQEVRRWASDFLNLWIPDPEKVVGA